MGIHPCDFHITAVAEASGVPGNVARGTRSTGCRATIRGPIDSRFSSATVDDEPEFVVIANAGAAKRCCQNIIRVYLPILKRIVVGVVNVLQTVVARGKHGTGAGIDLNKLPGVPRIVLQTAIEIQPTIWPHIEVSDAVIIGEVGDQILIDTRISVVRA